jgi:putative spermidine/putrescine transport system substrate-binding protein
MRRFDPILAALLLAAMIVATAAGKEADDRPRLRVLTWGGAYEDAQTAAFFTPFEAETGIVIETLPYNGGTTALERGATTAGSIDVVDMTGADARKACAAGLLTSFDADALAPAPDGTPPAEDFIKDAIGSCSVAQLLYATVIAYDDRAFPGVKPEQVADFFDLERFPGKRALQRRPTAILEWALYSYGVPRQQIYDLLSTERGLDLAFRRLDDIRDEIVWWRAGSEPPALLLRSHPLLGAAAHRAASRDRHRHAQSLADHTASPRDRHPSG